MHALKLALNKSMYASDDEQDINTWAATHNFDWGAHVQCLRGPHHGWGRRAKKILRNFNPLDWLKQASFQESP